MDKLREERFRKYLSQCNLDESKINFFVQQEQDGHAYYPMSVFMRNLWDWVRSKEQDNWVKPAIERLNTLYELGDKSGQIEALQNIQATNVDEKDVATLIYYGQIELLNFIVTMIDGGISLEKGEDSWGLFEIKDIDEEVQKGNMTKEKADQLYAIYGDTLVPTRSISGGMMEYVWDFEPNKDDTA